ncbi:MAG: RDD family protein [Magnetococcales bacterium]|nr:RDD family protein [Magnetococcales bacterium]
MAYDDPNAPSPTFDGFAKDQKSSVDQSKSFLGGQHHPWRRWFARMVDICTAGLLLLLLLMFALIATMPEQAAGFAKAIENPIVAGVVLYLVWVPAESVFLSLFGTTPAKWLFGIKVAHSGGNLLSLSESLNRSFLVLVQGMGFGIPFVALFTQLFAYRRLTKTGTTLWDTSSGAVVLHKKWGVVRALVCTAAVFGVLILMSALNAVGNR